MSIFQYLYQKKQKKIDKNKNIKYLKLYYDNIYCHLNIGVFLFFLKRKGDFYSTCILNKKLILN